MSGCIWKVFENKIIARYFKTLYSIYLFYSIFFSILKKNTVKINISNTKDRSIMTTCIIFISDKKHCCSFKNFESLLFFKKTFLIVFNKNIIKKKNY